MKVTKPDIRKKNFDLFINIKKSKNDKILIKKEILSPVIKITHK
jgi:hypothetical protein